MTKAGAPWKVATHKIDLGLVQIAVSTNAGPRILSYRKGDGPEFLASLPNAGIKHPDIGYYRFIGGHRLWRSPEVPATTYQPDDVGVHLTEFNHGVDIVGVADSDGVVKSMSIRQEGDTTVIHHRLINEGTAPLRTAPWAITQMALGGTAILPQAVGQADTCGLLPNRSLVLWPYTDLGSPELTFGVDHLTVEGTNRRSQMKLGQANRRGWMAYVLASHIFVKWSPTHDDCATYGDLGASAQIYRDERFLEVETLAPTAELAVGKDVSHTEVWKIIEMDDRPLDVILATLPEDPLVGEQ